MLQSIWNDFLKVLKKTKDSAPVVASVLRQLHPVELTDYRIRPRVRKNLGVKTVPGKEASGGRNRNSPNTQQENGDAGSGPAEKTESASRCRTAPFVPTKHRRRIRQGGPPYQIPVRKLRGILN
jgi:hypothetical protein